MRVLDLFSATQVPRADSASGQGVHDSSGIVSRPSRASCSCSTAKRRSGGDLVGGQCLAPDALRMTGMPGAHLGSERRSGSGFRLAPSSLPPVRNKSLSAPGCAHRTSSGSRGHSARSNSRNSASGSHRPGSELERASRTVGNAAQRGDQLSAAASGTSFCTLSSTTSTWRGLQHTRCRKIRSVSRI